MEKAMYPSPYIRITQKDHVGTHADCWAIDEAGSDGGIDFINTPFTGVIKRIYTKDANEVWLESVEPVLYADGTIDYMTIMFAHDNNVSNLKVNQILKQGERFYEEGTKGNATGNHIHLECGKGKFTGNGWHKDKAGFWSINNGKKIDECLWIDDTYHILDTAGYNFRNVKEAELKYLGTPIERNEETDQVKVFDATTVLRARNNPNGEVLGYVNSGIYNLLERKSDGDYEWFKIEENLWFAYSADWCGYLPKKEQKTESPVEEDKVKIEELEKQLNEVKKDKESMHDVIIELEQQINSLENRIIEVTEENSKLKEQLANQPTLIFTSPKTDYYAIKLKEGQKIYLN